MEQAMQHQVAGVKLEVAMLKVDIYILRVPL
jgi:hypothetical protein